VDEVEGRAIVGRLAEPLVELAFAEADAAKIEAQNDAADSDEAFGALEHGLRVHRAAELRGADGQTPPPHAA